jgi:hypothetical protein
MQDEGNFFEEHIRRKCIEWVWAIEIEERWGRFPRS